MASCNPDPLSHQEKASQRNSIDLLLAGHGSTSATRTQLRGRIGPLDSDRAHYTEETNDRAHWNAFNGEIHCCIWNAQALFDSRGHHQIAKQSIAERLANEADVTILTETHSSDAKLLGYRYRDEHIRYWSHGTAYVGGIGIWLNRRFCEANGLHNVHLTEAKPGRILRLTANTNKGSLNIVAMYCTSGHDSDSVNAKMEELRLLEKMLREKDTHLNIVGGAFNFTVDADDSLTSSTLNRSPYKWTQLADTWGKIGKRWGLNEMYQPKFTHRSSVACSRIDRIYTSHHAALQLDYNNAIWIEPFNAHSDHTPVHWQLVSNTPNQQGHSPKLHLDSRLFTHFEAIVKFKYYDTLWTVDYGNAAARLIHLKDMMRQAMGDIRAINEALRYEDNLNGGISARRLWSRGRFDEALDRIKRLKDGDKYIRQHHNKEYLHLESLNEMLIQEARKQCSMDVDNLHQERDGMDEHLYVQAKQRIMRQIKRTLPGECLQISAMIDDDGNVSGEKHKMADILRHHWGQVFKKKDRHDAEVDAWLDDWKRNRQANTATDNSGSELHHQRGQNGRVASRPSDGTPRQKPGERNGNDRIDSHLVRRNNDDWHIGKGHIKNAVRFARETAPGPDGIQASLWKAIGSLGIDVLYDMTKLLQRDDGTELLRKGYEGIKTEDGYTHAYNSSVLCCLPKTPAGEDPSLGIFYSAADTRPLSLVNVDNRCVSREIRLGRSHCQEDTAQTAGLFEGKVYDTEHCQARRGVNTKRGGGAKSRSATH